MAKIRKMAPVKSIRRNLAFKSPDSTGGKFSWVPTRIMASRATGTCARKALFQMKFHKYKHCD